MHLYLNLKDGCTECVKFKTLINHFEKNCFTIAIPNLNALQSKHKGIFHHFLLNLSEPKCV